MKQWAQTVMGCLTAGFLLLTGMPVWAEDDETAISSGRVQEVTDGSTFDDGTLTYTVLSNMQVSVTSCVTTATHISIMREIDGYDVVSIGEQAFAGCTALQSVTVPSSVTEIGAGAFQACTALQTVTLGSGVTEIPDGAFYGCSALETVTMENVTSLGRMAFAYCSAMTEFTVPDTVTELGDQLFMGCSSLESVELPEDITELSAYMFQNCSALTEFTIPDTITDLSNLPFIGCRNLATLTVSDTHPTFCLEDGVLYSKDMEILYLYPAGKTETAFAVPDSVTTIYDGAFFAAPLQTVTFPDGLQVIGSGAFEYCTSLESVTIPETVTLLSDHAFSDCDALRSVTFAGEETATEPALQIGGYAFYCCEQLMDVLLPKRVSEIGTDAFGVTEQQKVNADGSTSDETENIAVSGFLLTGYEGVAAKYVSSCRSDEGIRVNFKSLEIPWVKIVSISLACAVGLVLIFVIIRIVKKKRLSAEEKAALEAATAERKVPLAQREAEEAPEKTAEENYESILGEPAMTHQFGHETTHSEHHEE